jgi:hypothetical protein
MKKEKVVYYRVFVPQLVSSGRGKEKILDYGIDIKCLSYREALRTAGWVLNGFKGYKAVYINSVKNCTVGDDGLVEETKKIIKKS